MDQIPKGMISLVLLYSFVSNNGTNHKLKLTVNFSFFDISFEWGTALIFSVCLAFGWTLTWLTGPVNY